MNESTAIVGAGAIGCVLAVRLHGAGQLVVLCARTRIDRVIVDSDDETVEASIPVLTVPSDAGVVDWVLVTTKAQDTGSLGPWLSNLIGPDTVTVVIQNGVNQSERVEGLVTGAVLPATIYLGAERISPGRVRYREGQRITVPAGRYCDRLAELFVGTEVEIIGSKDFKTAAWLKLMSNLIANPLTALTLRRLDVLKAPGMPELARGLLTEAVAVASADGAVVTMADVDRTMAQIDTWHPGAGTSMLYDRLVGRSLECEYITGEVVRLGQRFGISTPLSGAILALLRAVSGRPLPV